MQKNHIFSRYIGCFLVAAILIFLSACSTGPRVVDHVFEFDARVDSPDVRILDYRYGNSKIHSARASALDVSRGEARQAAGINGPMLRGDDLYVRWQIKSTGVIYEDTVDLKKRLPWNMTDHRIYFVVKGPQLYVYLIAPQKRSSGEPEGPLRMYSDLRVIPIYPDQPEF